MQDQLILPSIHGFTAFLVSSLRVDTSLPRALVWLVSCKLDTSLALFFALGHCLVLHLKQLLDKEIFSACWVSAPVSLHL
jgi:hypothetical protein